jgi:ferric-dicitrate binding protein FerR (iron transport regulator)
VNEREPTATGAPPEDDEDQVRRLLGQAGPRPPIPPGDLAAITAATRAAWRGEVVRRARGAETAEHAGRMERRTPAVGGITELARYQEYAVTAPGRRQRPKWAVPALIAALLLLSAGLIWWLARRSGAAPEIVRAESVIGTTWIGGKGTGGPRPLRAGEAIPAGATVVTAAGTGQAVAGRASLRLADGTVLRLDAGTYARFVSPTAVALEQGAIYADSGENGSGLTVTTPAGTASDLGTRFSVRLIGLRRSALEIRVRDGAVAVERGSQSWLTPAGEELVVSPGGEPHRRPIDPWGPEWDWVLEAAAGYRIEGRTLGELLDWVTRETGWNVRWAEPDLAADAREIVLRGAIGRLRPDQAPFAVLPGAGLDGELVEGELIVRRRPGS